MVPRDIAGSSESTGTCQQETQAIMGPPVTFVKVVLTSLLLY